MTATVCIPWRPTPERIAAHDYCIDYWRTNRFNVIEADSDPGKPFLCNQARNNAVRQAQSSVVVISDADTIPHDITQVRRAISIAAAGHAVVWAYTIYRFIPPDTVGGADLYNAPVLNEAIGQTGGIIAVSRDTYWELGGYDELFTPGAWGYDDAAFWDAAQTLTEAVRVPGIVYSFDHPAERNTTDANPNKARHALYKLARGNPDIMRALLGL